VLWSKGETCRWDVELELEGEVGGWWECGKGGEVWIIVSKEKLADEGLRVGIGTEMPGVRRCKRRPQQSRQ